MFASIIIPTKNEAKLLPRLFASLAKQSKNVVREVIVADAHSTDATRVLAERFGAKIVDGGLPGVGRNRGAAHAREEWLCFFDADMELPHAHTLADALKAFEARQADFGTLRLVPDHPSFINTIYHTGYHLFVKLTAPWVPHIAGGCFFVRRSWFERAGGFDESVVFAEDMEFAQRLQRLGAKFAYLDEQKMRISTRRLERDGYGAIAYRFLRAEWYMRTRGAIRKELFPYGFEHV